jgi:predicted metal-binding protein
MPGGVPWQGGGRLIGQARGEALVPLCACTLEDAFQVSDGVDVPEANRPQLYICVSCHARGAEPPEADASTDGRKLYDAVQALAAEMDGSAPAHILPTLCFANCERGCTAGIAAPGKWSYLMGDLSPEHAADLLLYCDAYANAKSGVVLPSVRPASLQKTVIARFPANFEPAKDAAE